MPFQCSWVSLNLRILKKLRVCYAFWSKEYCTLVVTVLGNCVCSYVMDHDRNKASELRQVIHWILSLCALLYASHFQFIEFWIRSGKYLVDFNSCLLIVNVEYQSYKKKMPIAMKYHLLASSERTKSTNLGWGSELRIEIMLIIYDSR